MKLKHSLLCLLVLAFANVVRAVDTAPATPSADPTPANSTPAPSITPATPSTDSTSAAVVPTSPLAAPGFSTKLPNVNIRLDMQVVAIPEAIGIPLTAEMKDKNKIETANAKVQHMIAKGTAKLIGWPILTTVNGQRAVYEAIQEIQYAVQYDPPTINAGVSDESTTTKVKPTVDVTAFDGVPTSFQTRNIGITLEAEPVLDEDGKAIQLNLVPQDVRLKGYKKVTIEGATRKGKVIVEQPIFETRKITTSLRLQDGSRTLLGVYPIDDPPKHLEFFILKVETIPVN